MRFLLVTLSDLLPSVITQILSPTNSYCAIVVDEPEPAKNFIRSLGGSENLVYNFYDLKECVENFHYDFILCVADGRLI